MLDRIDDALRFSRRNERVRRSLEELCTEPLFEPREAPAHGRGIHTQDAGR
jgi:hypothetical protein